MKALFLALLLGNLLFFGWSRWHAPPAPGSVAVSGDAAPTLKLIEEPKKPKVRKATAVTLAAENAANSATTPATARCLSVGPFHDLPEASEASVSLRQLGYGPRTRAAEGDVWGGLWVYLEDLPSRAEAQRVMTLLKQNGMTDAYIMPSTEQQTIDISLGIFSETPRAQRRATEVRKLGFVPTLAERARKGTVYWLDVDVKPGGVAISPADLLGRDRNLSGAIVRLEVKPCPAAAAASE